MIAEVTGAQVVRYRLAGVSEVEIPYGTSAPQDRVFVESPRGDTLAVYDAAANRLSRLAYRPYGESQPIQNPTAAGPRRWGGRNGGFTDDGTGLVLFGARWYAPALGRWLTPDPTGQEGGLNLYAYCDNDPVNKVDVDGRQGSRITAALWMPFNRRNNSFPKNIPLGVDIMANVRQAYGLRNLIENGGFGVNGRDAAFYNLVKNRGPWDYKYSAPRGTLLRDEYEKFGNWHYGLVGAAAGFPLNELLRAAGYAQGQAGSSPKMGHPLGASPYGDDPTDQIWIKRGYDAYTQIPQMVRTGYRPFPIFK